MRDIWDERRDADFISINSSLCAMEIDSIREIYKMETDVNISTPHCTLAPYASAGVALRSNADERRELCS
jgi:hypothetical protein